MRQERRRGHQIAGLSQLLLVNLFGSRGMVVASGSCGPSTATFHHSINKQIYGGKLRDTSLLVRTPYLFKCPQNPSFIFFNVNSPKKHYFFESLWLVSSQLDIWVVGITLCFLHHFGEPSALLFISLYLTPLFPFYLLTYPHLPYSHSYLFFFPPYSIYQNFWPYF